MKADQRRIGRARLVAVEAGLGGAVAGAAFQSPWGYALAGAGALVTAGALLRLRGRWADQRLLAGAEAGSFRTSSPATPRAAAGAGSDDLGVVRTLLPTLDVIEVPDRNGPDLGVIADGRGLAAILELPGNTLPSLPAGLVARWLDEDPARPAAAQLVVEQFGLPPWDVHHRYQPTIAYRQLPAGARPIAVRSWLVVRFDPFAAPEAVDRRGGGATGARAALAAATARLAARLTPLGAASTPLGAAEVRAVLRGTGDVSAEGRALAGGWTGGAATHCTVTARVHGQDDWGRLLTGLAGRAAERVVTAATVTREGPAIRLRTAVRVVSGVDRDAVAERERLQRAGLVGELVPDQGAGLLATLPLAHPVRSLVAVAGLAGPARAGR
ncbi:type VII secretion protein EccE [Streptomyces mayteni]